MEGIARFLRGFVHAGRGVGFAAGERNFRVHLLATVLVLAAAAWLGVGPREWALLTLAIGLVLALEAMNSAVEALADRISREQDPLVGRAKDLAAGAVLLAALAAAAVGLIVFLPHLLPHLLAHFPPRLG